MFGQMIKLVQKYGYVFLQGTLGTLWMSALVVAVGTVLGILVALMRMSRLKPLSAFANIFVEIIRGLPALIQLYFFWLVLPKIIPTMDNDTVNIMVALIVNAAAYISEIIRAGIQAVEKGQWEAARSLGLSERNVFMRVILPQAIKNILPALCNEFISTLKGTSLASVFFLQELTTSYKTVGAATFLYLPSLIISGIIYLILGVGLSKLVALLERRLKSNE